jgi:ASC-1-like (ASCH) protein
MHVKPNYFALLKSGDKLVEFRLNDAKRKKISAGDKIRFICQDDLRTDLVLSVSDIITSSDFSSLLKKFPLAMLGSISYEEQLSDLRNFYSMDNESECGVIAIVLKELAHA